MSGMSSGYDQSVGTYSPDGRVFQVEYAQKAVDLSGTLVGLKCKDGVVMGVEKTRNEKMTVQHSNKRIYNVDQHIGIAVGGILPDGRQICNQAMDEAQQHKEIYGEPIPAKVLLNRISYHVHAYTLYGSYRPYGASCLIACHDLNGYSLYLLEPNGVAHQYKGVSIGKGRQSARTEVEKLDFANLTVQQGILEVARILHMAHDSEKPFELEISIISNDTNAKHVHLPRDILQQADDHGRKKLDEDMDED